MLTVGIGEIISCGVIGIILLYCLKPYKKIFYIPGFAKSKDKYDIV